MISQDVKIWNKHHTEIEQLCLKWGVYSVLKETEAYKGITEALSLFRQFAKGKILSKKLQEVI